jgi:DNA-binding transcriptional MerR regulator
MFKVPVTQTSPYELRLVSARAVADRYGISLRSVDRWLSKKVIPPPDRVINNRRYWYLASLERADRLHTASAGAFVTAG